MRFWLRTFILALLLFMLLGIDFIGLSTNSILLGSPGWLILSASVVAAALGWAAVNSSWRGWRLATTLFLAYYGIATLMTAIESVYLVELREVAVTLLLNGALTAALFAPAVVVLHGRWRGEGAAPLRLPSLGSLAWRLPVLATLWMVLFVVAGLFVFTPIAQRLAPALLESGYADVPAWVLPFQGLRALLWVGVSLPLLVSLSGRRSRRALVLAAVFGALMGANLLVPNPLMPTALTLAHFAEVALSSALFGFLTALLLAPESNTAQAGIATPAKATRRGSGNRSSVDRLEHTRTRG